jgi:RimJ/RimL family protein N-acetyltransferase
MIPRVRTERLLMREWRDSDLDVFARMYADPDVTRYLGDGTTMDREQTWRAMASAAGHWLLRGYGQWVLELQATGEVVGRSGLYNPEGWPGLEVGWAIAPEHQRKGYASEAGAASLRYAFENLGVKHMISLIYQENLPSIGVARKLGGTAERLHHFPSVEVLVFGYDRPPGIS